MDPQLWEEIATGDGDGEIDAIVRLFENATPPEQIRIVSRFGDIATCRLRRRDIIEVRRHPSVRSLKASRGLNTDYGNPDRAPDSEARTHRRVRRRPRLRETGAGVIVGVIDYGCDFAHHAFRNRNGSSRIKHLWDQRASSDESRAPEPYARGRLFNRSDINAALRKADPYAALDYEFDGESHGTHVLDIAAGNGRGEGAKGLAPEAEIIFVHVAASAISESQNFGDSVALLEALDFINRMAGDQPTAINISMGMHGGPHDGTTLVERAVDTMLGARHGLSVQQSCGNYYKRKIHCSGRLLTGATVRTGWTTKRENRGRKELEFWCSGLDRMSVTIQSPDRKFSVSLAPDSRQELRIGRRLVGRAYHRVDDPGNGDTHIDIFLYANAPSGEWAVSLEGTEIHDGRWHAWIERDGRGAKQSQFSDGPISKKVTCGTIAHGRAPVQVTAHRGGYSRGGGLQFTSFSSAGPSRDGRKVPLIAAPGERIWAASSADQTGRSTHREVREESGTSMATPHVTGLVALILQAAPRASQRQIRAILKLTARRVQRPPEHIRDRARWGALREVAAVRAARRLNARAVDALPVSSAPDTYPRPVSEAAHEAISEPEWRIIGNWAARHEVPTDGAGALPAGISARNSEPLPMLAPDAARTVAQALLNYRADAAGLSGPPTPLPNRSYRSHPVLDPLARQLIAAIRPSAAEWSDLGAFMETQSSAAWHPGTTQILFAADDQLNRRNMAHFLACIRLRNFPGAGPQPAYCRYPQQGAVDPAIAILMGRLKAAGPLVDWSRLDMDVRRAHVMHRLVTEYRYRRAVAAGIVGNLEAESRIDPQRVEGAREGAPRTAVSVSRLPRRQANKGPRRQFSSDQIMNRPGRPPYSAADRAQMLQSPYFPGIGLAQWTTPDRRARFYAHRYNGVQPGQYIIFFMDAQIDLLVNSLQTHFQPLERRLRAAGETLNDAADDFVYSFEKPGEILEPDPTRPGRSRLRRRSDPQVQAVFAARRGAARRALRAYAAAHPVSPPPGMPSGPISTDSEVLVRVPQAIIQAPGLTMQPLPLDPAFTDTPSTEEPAI